jgi:DNA polymerase
MAPSTAETLLADLTARGFAFTAERGGLGVRPASQLSDADRTAVRAHKAELLALLTAPIFLDLETRSVAKLHEVGGRRYAAHPTTEILTAVALLDDLLLVWTPLLEEPLRIDTRAPGRPVETFAGPALPEPLATAIRAGRAICAHNAWGFDRHVWQARGLLEPSAWLDTLPLARAAGLPGSLDGVAAWLFGGRKDPAGKKLIDRFARPYGKGERFRELTPDDWLALARYCARDVLLLAQAYPLLAGYAEAGVLPLDQAINERGVRLDRELARAVLDLEAADTTRLAALAEQLTGGEVSAGDLGRVAFLGAWLESKGCAVPRTATGKPQLTKAVAPPSCCATGRFPSRCGPSWKPAQRPAR